MYGSIDNKLSSCSKVIEQRDFEEETFQSQPLRNRASFVPTVSKVVDVSDIDMSILEPKPLRDVRTIEWYEFLPLKQQKADEFRRPLNQIVNTRSMKFDPIFYLSRHAI